MLARARSTALALASATVVAALGAGGAAGPAQAAAPTPKSMRILPATAIGGVRLGMTYDEAIGKWGSGSTCALADADELQRTGKPLNRKRFTGMCSWFVNDVDTTAGAARILFDKGKVWEVGLTAAQNSAGEPSRRGPIRDLRTTRGRIGVGSSVSALLKTYRLASPTPSGFALVRKDRMTSFGTSGGRVGGVALLYTKNY